MCAYTPPRGLRVLQFRNRLVLHDLTFALRGHPVDRNALIDAANSVQHRPAPSDTLIPLDVAPPPSTPRSASIVPSDRFLVLPFATEQQPHVCPHPFEASAPHRPGIDPSPGNDAVFDVAAAFLGLLPLRSALYAVLVTQIRHAADHPLGPVYSLAKVRLIPLSSSPACNSKDEKEALAPVIKLLESPSMYYSITTDITMASQPRQTSHFADAFCWNYPMLSRLSPSLQSWTVRLVYGFIATNPMRFQLPSAVSAPQVNVTLLSRRSRFRAGTRYITRGVDALGNVANFVETEQIVWTYQPNRPYTSFTILRGSIPIFWRQNNGIAKPSPQLDGTLVASRRAFSRHFDALRAAYGTISAVSLIDKQGSEGTLAHAFEQHFDLFLKAVNASALPKLVAFDFHKHCAGKEYERGLALLLESLQQDADTWGFFSPASSASPELLQNGAFRVNCVDCLDRTNVVQSMIARSVLSLQVKHVFAKEFSISGASKLPFTLFAESEDRYKHLWGDHADAVSKQYSGTGALKTDFTRTGKRSTTGVIGDGVKSVMRMYYKNFVDEGRQEVIDILCGNVAFRPPALTDSYPFDDPSSPSFSQREDGSSSLSAQQASGTPWHSFRALRVNAGGDKQSVILELHDEHLFVITPDALCFEFPKNAFSSWSKPDDGKISEKKIVPARLRLIFLPSVEYPATTSPLELVFKAGNVARENFLRALCFWAKPKVIDLLGKRDFRIRVMASVDLAQHEAGNWAISKPSAGKLPPEVVALVLPEVKDNSRKWGLAAVPVNVDTTDYVLVGATAVGIGAPAIAVLVSKSIAPSVMQVGSAVFRKASSGGINGAAAVTIQVCGTTVCFVSTKVQGKANLEDALRSLKLGRVTFDVTNQYHHFYVAGLLGDTKFSASNRPGRDRGAEKWFRLSDGSLCYGLENGLSIIRREFPTLKYNETGTGTLHDQGNPHQPSSRASVQSVVLSDGIVEGRQGPEISKDMMQYRVIISQLRAEELEIPRGIEQVAQMTTVVVVYSDLATADGFASRQSQRASQYPEWRDPVQVVMIPSKRADIEDSFLVGQIVIPMHLADPVSAGHFVLPVSYAGLSNGEFDIPCRLAGRQTGRLLGRVTIEGGIGGDSSWQSATPNSSQQKTSFSGIGSRNSLPPVPSTNGSRGEDIRRPHSALVPVSDGFPPMSKKKGAMGEVNDKLNMAKRKGTKQMKSMVNRLSSFLNQSSNGGGSAARSSSSLSEYVGADWRASGMDAVQENRENQTRQPSVDQNEVTISSERDGSTKAPSPQNNSSNSSGGNLSSGITARDGADRLRNLGLQQLPREGRSLSSGTKGNRASSAPPLHMEDSLLKGLNEVRVSSQSSASRGERPKHVMDSDHDSLLSGLARQKVGTKAERTNSQPKFVVDDDDWGDFESATAEGNKTSVWR